MQELIGDHEVINRMQEMVDKTFKTWGGFKDARLCMQTPWSDVNVRQ